MWTPCGRVVDALWTQSQMQTHGRRAQAVSARQEALLSEPGCHEGAAGLRRWRPAAMAADRARALPLCAAMIQAPPSCLSLLVRACLAAALVAARAMEGARGARGS